MQKKVENKVLEYCKKHKLLDKGDRIVVGVSGGADSVCLLFVLLSLQAEYNLKLHVVHVHHGIRPEAAEDADYVERLCREKGLPFTYVRRDIPAEAEELGCSEEEAGRKARYEIFEDILRKEGAQKIAVAHNANDRAETMLFHLFRGTGLTGLSSIKPGREQVIRPILCLERAEIEAYLESIGVAYCHDKTNDSDNYTRNKIRHHIIPFAEAEIVDGAVGNMVRTADILAETENYIEEQVEKAKETCVQKILLQSSACEEWYRVDCVAYLQLHSVIQKRLLLMLLKELSPMHKDIAAVHVEAVHTLLLQEGNRQVHLPYGIRGSREYEAVILGRSDYHTEPDEEVVVDEVLREKGEEEVRREDGVFYFTLLEIPEGSLKCKDIPQNQYTKWFDYDKIKERLVIRYRKTGDYLCTRGNGNLQHKKIKDYMIDEKIPGRLRDRISLPADGEHVLWVPGYRISEYYKVDSSTKRILQINYESAAKTQTGSGQEGENMAEHVEVLLTEEEVDARIREIAEQINKDYEGKEIHLICVLKGGSFFMCELAKRITVPVSLDFMSVSSYGSGTQSSGRIKIVKDLDESVMGKDVLVVEDIVDSGRTLSYLMQLLRDRGAQSLRLCTLLDKPDRRVVEVPVDYTCFQIPDEFVVGYGLDYAQRYRNLPYIGIVRFD